MAQKKPDFSYGIIITDNKVVAEGYINGKKNSFPLYVGSNNSYDIAQACRRAAYALLERADIVQHSQDFYHEINAQNQIELMMEENKSIFD